MDIIKINGSRLNGEQWVNADDANHPTLSIKIFCYTSIGVCCVHAISPMHCTNIGRLSYITMIIIIIIIRESAKCSVLNRTRSSAPHTPMHAFLAPA